MKRRSLTEKSMHMVFILCGLITVAFLAVITIFLATSGLPAIKKIGITDFLFGKTWSPTAKTPLYGILPFILSSILGTLGATAIGVPIGLLCAVYISKFAGKRTSKILTSKI